MNLADSDLAALEAALALEGIEPQIRTRILSRLVHRDPTGPDYPGVRLDGSRIIAAQQLSFGRAAEGELVGVAMAAMARDMWASAGPVTRFWLEWNVAPPPSGLPATLMRMAAQVDPDPDPEPQGPLTLCANWDEQ